MRIFNILIKVIILWMLILLNQEVTFAQKNNVQEFLDDIIGKNDYIIDYNKMGNYFQLTIYPAYKINLLGDIKIEKYNPDFESILQVRLKNKFPNIKFNIITLSKLPNKYNKAIKQKEKLIFILGLMLFFVLNSFFILYLFGFYKYNKSLKNIEEAINNKGIKLIDLITEYMDKFKKESLNFQVSPLNFNKLISTCKPNTIFEDRMIPYLLYKYYFQHGSIIFSSLSKKIKFDNLIEIKKCIKRNS